MYLYHLKATPVDPKNDFPNTAPCYVYALADDGFNAYVVSYDFSQTSYFTFYLVSSAFDAHTVSAKKSSRT